MIFSECRMERLRSIGTCSRQFRRAISGRSLTDPSEGSSSEGSASCRIESDPPLVYGIIQAAITTAVATAIATHQLTDFNMRFVEEWFFACGISFLTMFPVVIFVAPFIQRCVLALTLTTAGDGLN